MNVPLRCRDPLENFLLVTLALGLLCRLCQYFANTSIWHDEAFIALNILQKDVAGLLGQLDWHEASPPGFLIVEKGVVSLLGRSEYAFRLVPLLAGLAGMVAFAGLARAIRGSNGASLWAILLMAASAKLIVQSNEVKHFTLDLLCAISLTWMAIGAPGRPRPRGLLLWWGGIGAASLWLSYASLFVFAGTSLALFPQARHVWRKRERKGLTME